MGSNELATARALDAEPQITRRMLSIIKTGDLGQLTEPEQLAYYLHECRRMGLDPAARPLEWVQLQGKLTLYARRVAGDMLAAKHDVSVALLDGPRVLDVDGKKVLYARAKASMPSGRSVEDVGTLQPRDPANDLMKVVSKSFRRATLRLCGWGGLDESELESIPTARLVPGAVPDADEPAVVASVRDALGGEVDVPLELAAGIYCDHLARITADDQDAVVAALRAALPRGTSMAALRRAIEAERSRRAAPPRADDSPAAAEEPDALDDYQAALAAAADVADVARVWRENREWIGMMPTATDRKCAWADAVARVRALTAAASDTAAGAILKRAVATLDEPPPDGDGPRGGRPANDAAPPADAQGASAPAAGAGGASARHWSVTQWAQHIATRSAAKWVANSYADHVDQGHIPEGPGPYYDATVARLRRFDSIVEAGADAAERELAKALEARAARKAAA